MYFWFFIILQLKKVSEQVRQTEIKFSIDEKPIYLIQKDSSSKIILVK